LNVGRCFRAPDFVYDPADKSDERSPTDSDDGDDGKTGAPPPSAAIVTVADEWRRFCALRGVQRLPLYCKSQVQDNGTDSHSEVDGCDVLILFAKSAKGEPLPHMRPVTAIAAAAVAAKAQRQRPPPSTHMGTH
jgi:hypothetical protein